MKTHRYGRTAALRSCTLAAAIVAPCSAAVTTLDFDFTSTDWQSAEWSSEGDAGFVNDTGLAPLTGVSLPSQRLRLTSSNRDEAGTAWYNDNQFDLSSGDWSFSYQGQISVRSDSGADGMGMHLYAGDFAGSSLDQDGIGRTDSIISVAIDTYDNGGSDPSSYHMTLKFNNFTFGQVNLSGENDEAFDITLAYTQATNTLTASYVMGAYTQTITKTGAFLEGELAEQFGEANWGFSARTGGEFENHDVLGASATYEVSAVPEPSGALGLAGLIAGSAFLRRRKAASGAS